MSGPAEAPSTSYDVFVSYAHEDRARVEEIVDGLKAEGLSVWWDERLHLGQRFDTEIDDHLSTSAGAVVVWSRQSVDKGYVRAEAQAAWSTGKLAAVMIENCKPRVPFNVEQYADLTDWQGNRNHPGWLKLVERLRVLVQMAGRQPPPRPDPLKVYRDALRDDFEALPQLFQDMGAGTLSDMFVRLDLAEPVRDPQADGPPAQAAADTSTPQLSVADVMALPDRCWTFIGDPGSGKTGLLRRFGLELLSEVDGPVPIYARVAGLPSDTTLSTLLSLQEGKPTAASLEAQIEKGKAVLLLDGFDEHPDPRRARELVVRLAHSVGTCKVFMTSRLLGYRRPSRQFRELQVCPLDRQGQLDLLRRWIPDHDRVTGILDAMNKTPRLAKLVRNPLLLTLVGVLLKSDRTSQLPSRSSELYGRLIHTLLDASHHDLPASERFPDKALTMRALRRIALAQQLREQGVTSVDELARELEQAGLVESLRHSWPAGPSAFLAEVAQRTGLLQPEPNEHNVEGYRFPHRGVREYLAAGALASDIADHGLPEVPAHVLRGAAVNRPVSDTRPRPPGRLADALDRATAELSSWAEVLAYTSSQLGDHDERWPDRLVRWVAARGEPDLLRRVMAEAEALSLDTMLSAFGVQAGDEHWRARRDLLLDLPQLVPDPHTAVGLLQQFSGSETTHGADRWFVSRQLRVLASTARWGHKSRGRPVDDATRARAELLLAKHWRDHRFEEREQVLRALTWQRIPAGVLGGLAMHVDFRMSAVPITNEIYALFDPGHAFAPDASNHPAADVSWFEAAAFAAWLGVGVRLPLEIEWEYACRAGSLTRYCNGETDADLRKVGWYDNGSIDQVMPVGALEPNRWGLYDMHGNVWEWCADKWQDHPTLAAHTPRDHLAMPHEDDHRGARAIRGGSFAVPAEGAEAGARRPWRASARVPDVGFRLVRVAEGNNQGPQVGQQG